MFQNGLFMFAILQKDTTNLHYITYLESIYLKAIKILHGQLV